MSSKNNLLNSSFTVLKLSKYQVKTQNAKIESKKIQ